MPSLFRTRRFKDDEIVVCIDGFAGALDSGREVIYKKGARLRASDPAVRKWPELFARDGASDDELQQQRAEVFFPHHNEVIAKADREFREEQAQREPKPIPPEERVEVLRDFRIGLRLISEGAVFSRNDPLVKRHPEFFGEPRRPLVTE
jgi:hypothetical protein